MKLEALFDRRLIVVSGKGGVGKTTVAAALASLAARSGKTVLLLFSDGRGDGATLFGRPDPGYVETLLEPKLYGITTDFESLLFDFVRSNAPVKMLQDRILASSVFRYFTRATPGLPELLLLGKIRAVFARKQGRVRPRPYDLVVLDAPATGHALSLLAMPRTILKTVPAGPLRKIAVDLDAVLSSPGDAALVVVAEPAELAAREAEEIVTGAQERAGLATGLLVENRVGRSGRTETLPDVELPTVPVPELDSGEEPSDDPRFFAAFRAALQSGTRTKREPRRAGASAVRDDLDLNPWLSDSKLIVLAGPGGVGKTTLAASVGIAAARRGRRVLVLTVDPARRLAQALGVESLLDSPADVRIQGLPPKARLRALQIDPKSSFERLLPRIAPAATVARIRKNRMYAGLVDSLPGVLEYMGVEALAEHAQDPDVDLIVLDTPPAARGIDFLSSPDRIVALLEHDALRWFLRSDSLLSRALSGASRGATAVLKLADNVLGFGFLGDLADFFRVFDGLYDGFKERSLAISAELQKGRFLVVSSIDRSALATAAETAEAFARRSVTTALLLNRVPKSRGTPSLPPALRSLPRKTIHEVDVPLEDLPETLADELRSRP